MAEKEDSIAGDFTPRSRSIDLTPSTFFFYVCNTRFSFFCWSHICSLDRASSVGWPGTCIPTWPNKNIIIVYRCVAGLVCGCWWWPKLYGNVRGGRGKSSATQPPRVKEMNSPRDRNYISFTAWIMWNTARSLGRLKPRLDYCSSVC